MTAWTFHEAGFPPVYVLQALAQACTPVRRPGTVTGRRPSMVALVGHDEVVDVPVPVWDDSARLPADDDQAASDIPPSILTPNVTPVGRRFWGATLSMDRAPAGYCAPLRCYCGACPSFTPLAGVTYSPHLGKAS